MLDIVDFATAVVTGLLCGMTDGSAERNAVAVSFTDGSHIFATET
jgi:hypothetical protein